MPKGITNGVAKATIKIGAEVFRNVVDVKNDSSSSLNISLNSVQETIINSSLGIIGGEVSIKFNPRPFKYKSVNKVTEAAREASHYKEHSFSASQAKQVQKETKQYNAGSRKNNDVISNHANGAIGNIIFGIIKIDEEEK